MRSILPIFNRFHRGVLMAGIVGCQSGGQLALADAGTTSTAREIERGDVAVTLSGVATGLDSPVWGIDAPGISGHLIIADQSGLVWDLNLNEGTRNLFFDARSRLQGLSGFASGNLGERGLLGIAFHPEYASNGLVYTYTSESTAGRGDFSTLPNGADPDHQSVINEWQVSRPSEPGASVNTSSVRELLRVDQPQSNHNGGAIQFGPDGNLYIALGDGGGANDSGVGHGTDGNGQDTGNPLGALLRIDPDGDSSSNGAYGVPSDNPLLGNAGAVAEIYAYGFRNPYRMSFDRVSGELWTGDVGQGQREEVDRVVAGGNYGWNLKEGLLPFQSGDLPPGLIDPVAEYDHSEGLAVIGGFVYRGSRITGLGGRYTFGDFGGSANGRLFYLAADDAIRELDLPADFGLSLLGFAEDGAGEIYALAKQGGGSDGGLVLRLDPRPPAQPAPVEKVWWGGEALSGQGLQLVQRGSRIGGAWYLFDETGEDLWVTFVGTIENAAASVDLLRFTGPALGTSWDTSLVQAVVAGTAELSFASADSISVTATLAGRAITLDLLPFDPAATGEFGKVWLDPARSGQGLQVLHSGNRVSGAWYLYDEQGRDMWLTFVGELQSDSVSAALNRFSGPPLGTEWDPSLVVGSNVGNVTIDFSSPYSARMSYTVNGQSGEMLLAPFGL